MSFSKDKLDEMARAQAVEAAALNSFEYHIGIAIQLSEAVHGWGDDDYGHLRELFNQALRDYAKLSKPTSLQAPIACRSEKPYTKSKISTTKKKTVLERDKYRCINCDTHKDLCVDHIQPESRGGDNTLSNLQTLCRSCNSSKGTKTMQEWEASK